jgi:hypothetical protein
MLKRFVPFWAVVAAASAAVAGEKPKPGFAKKGGLSLTVALDKKTYEPADEIALRFALKNEGDKDVFIGDRFLAPDYQEAGPGRHFEVHVKAGGKNALYFWSGMMTEGEASGIRKVFKLKPGEEYKGVIRLSAGTVKDKKYAELPHEQRGGSFEDRVTRKKHVLGADGQEYTVELRYQVDPKSHGTWKPPADFKDQLLWKGELTTAPLEFKVSAK